MHFIMVLKRVRIERARGVRRGVLGIGEGRGGF